MLKTGEFSKLSRISVQMLRHYDEIGLLHPVHTDSFSGYRYYCENQLPTANAIQSLRAMGMGLYAIGKALAANNAPASLRHLLHSQLNKQRPEKAALEEQIRLLSQALDCLDQRKPPLSVAIKEIPGMKVASCRDYLNSYDQEGRLWHILFSQLEQQQLKLAVPSYQMAIFHDESFSERHIDVEVQCAVTALGKSNGSVVYKKRESVVVTSHTFQGSYTLLSAVNAGIAQWIAESGYRLSGTGFNIYHISPHSTGNPDDWVTEVCFPVTKK